MARHPHVVKQRLMQKFIRCPQAALAALSFRAAAGFTVLGNILLRACQYKLYRWDQDGSVQEALACC